MSFGGLMRYKAQTNNNNKITKLIAKLQVALCLVLFCSFFSIAPAYSMTQQEYQTQVDQLDAQIAAANENISQLSQQKKTLNSEISVLDAQIDSIQLKINVFQQQIDLTTSQINLTNEQISQAEIDLTKQKELMNEYLRTMYIEGQTSTIELIAKSKNFSDFVDQSEYLGSIQEKVQETAINIIKLKSDLGIKKKEIETEKSKNEQLKSEQVIAQNGIQSQKNTKDQLVNITNGQEANYQASVKDAQKKEAQVWADYQRSIQSSPSNGGSTYTGGGGNGYLMMPVQGYISQGYGKTDYTQYQNNDGSWGCTYGGYYPNCEIHNGIDIASYLGASIRGAADGKVIGMGYSGGWGNWIVLEHPNGLATLYAHLDSSVVSKGQNVTKGQIIGYEGTTGFSTGPHLHFSVYSSLILYSNGPGYGGTVNPYSFL